MLGAVPYAQNVPLRRVDAFTQIAKNAGAQLQILDITVSTEDRVTKYGVQRRAAPTTAATAPAITAVRRTP